MLEMSTQCYLPSLCNGKFFCVCLKFIPQQMCVCGYIHSLIVIAQYLIGLQRSTDK